MEKYINNKTGEVYTKLSGKIINSTNAQDGQTMIGYYNNTGGIFVREEKEFNQKFTRYEQ